MEIKVVGFDLDDTLYDRYFIYKKVFEKMETNHISLEVPFNVFNEVLQEYSLIEFDLFAEGLKHKEEYKIDRVVSAYKHFDVNLSNNLANKFNDYYLYYRNKIKPRENVKKLLKKLKLLNIPIFVLTNGPEKDQKEKLLNLGLMNFFESNMIYISDSIGYAKPNPKLFSFVEDSLSVKGENILYIGDNLVNDIIASNKHQWNSIYFNFENLDEEILDSYSNIATAKNFFDVENILKKADILN